MATSVARTAGATEASIGRKSRPGSPRRAASARAVAHVPECSSTSPETSRVIVRGDSGVGAVVAVGPGVVELGVVELGAVEAVEAVEAVDAVDVVDAVDAVDAVDVVDVVDVEPLAVGVAPSWLVQPVAALSASRTIAPSAAPVLLGGGSRMRTRTQLTKSPRSPNSPSSEEA